MSNFAGSTQPSSQSGVLIMTTSSASHTDVVQCLDFAKNNYVRLSNELQFEKTERKTMSEKLAFLQSRVQVLEETVKESNIIEQLQAKKITDQDKMRDRVEKDYAEVLAKYTDATAEIEELKKMLGSVSQRQQSDSESKEVPKRFTANLASCSGTATASTSSTSAGNSNQNRIDLLKAAAKPNVPNPKSSGRDGKSRVPQPQVRASRRLSKKPTPPRVRCSGRLLLRLKHDPRRRSPRAIYSSIRRISNMVVKESKAKKGYKVK